jgi:hypothetical protein
MFAPPANQDLELGGNLIMQAMFVEAFDMQDLVMGVQPNACLCMRSSQSQIVSCKARLKKIKKRVCSMC